MPAPQELRAIEQQMERVYRLYAGLAGFNLEAALGGKLLYVGEPDEAGCDLLRAANIAGAASIAASADAALLRSAMREGALDFVVTSLDEGLRILKNEIRRQQPVAVGVSVSPETMFDEMAERGVQPDLLAPGLHAGAAMATLETRGAQTVEPQSLPAGCGFHILPIPAEWKQAAGAVDALLLECLPPEDSLNRRWVQLAPRYLASSARRLRSMACNAATAQEAARLIQTALSNQVEAAT